MRKRVIILSGCIISVIVITIGLIIFNNKHKDKKIVEHLSNQKYAEDVVANGEMKKYDIAPKATPVVVKEKPLEMKELEKNTVDEMTYIFTGICAYICETSTEYNAYEDKFYADVIKYVSVYSQDSIKKGCEVSSEKITLSKKNLKQISGASFVSRQYGYEEFDLKEYKINYNEKTDKYEIDNDVVTGYSITVDYVKEVVLDSAEKQDDSYEVQCTVLKNGNKDNQVKFMVTSNQLEDSTFEFSVKNAYVVKN